MKTIEPYGQMTNSATGELMWTRKPTTELLPARNKAKSQRIKQYSASEMAFHYSLPSDWLSIWVKRMDAKPMATVEAPSIEQLITGTVCKRAQPGCQKQQKV